MMRGFQGCGSRAVIAIFAVVGVVGCTPGALSSEMGKTPDIPDQEKCDPASLDSVMSPLVMQWSTAARADVESALQDGVVVVNYSCEGVKVLQDCHVPGHYGYRALTPKSDDALIEGADNIRASFGGGPFSFGGGVDRSAKLDLSYMLVGKRATVRGSVHRGELEGDDFCKGATHFIKRVDIGAWTMVAGKDVTAGLAAKVMSQGIDANSSSKELRSKKDGDPKSCAGATREDDSPPGGCGALIRVTMAPIKTGNGPGKSDNVAARGVSDDAGCPTGFAYTDAGVCIKDVSKAKAILCKRGDRADCRKQCINGSNKSCNRYANILQYENQEGSKEQIMALAQEVKPALPRLEAACMADEPAPCSVVALAEALAAETSEDDATKTAAYKKVVTLMGHGCVGGDARACGFFRQVIVADKSMDEKLGIHGRTLFTKLLKRGCDGGGAVPCGELAFDKVLGGEVARNPAEAMKLANNACLGNYARACVLRSALLRDKAGCEAMLDKFDDKARRSYTLSNVCVEENLSAIDDNAKEAAQLQARACSLGVTGACQ